jgi:hypothetical protein
MSRPRIATAILDTRGSFLQHPSRIRPYEPDTDQPLGDPPTRLSPEVQAIWREVSADLLPGVGKVSDRTMFEVLCLLIFKLRQGTQKIMELNAMVSLCGRFGMSPSDRSKIAVDAPPSTALTRFINSQVPKTPAN